MVKKNCCITIALFFVSVINAQVSRTVYQHKNGIAKE